MFSQRKLETKRVFVRLVSHEIRTPLTVVMMGLKLLEKDLAKLDPSRTLGVAKLLETVKDSEMSCETAVEILDDLLAYEKLDAGIMLLEKTILPAWEFVKETVRPFNVQVSECHCNHPPSLRL